GSGLPAASALALLREDLHRAVHADGQHVIVLRNRFVLAVVLQIGTEAADAGQDRLLGFGVIAHGARQRKQLARLLDGHVVGLDALRDRLALGLLPFGTFAQLHVMAIRPLAKGYRRDL